MKAESRISAIARWSTRVRTGRRRPKDAPTTTTVMANAALDATLRQHGYVQFELLDSSTLEAARAAWSNLGDDRPQVFDPTGFGTTARHAGSREVADDAIRPIVERALASHLVNHAPFLSAFLVKRAGCGELPAHLDWRLLDEVDAHTYGCWIALTDVVGDNGVLGVVPGSHLLVDFDRTPEAPGQEWCDALIAGGADVVDLAVRAGQAVVYDHRLVHRSRPNTTSTDRVSINCGVAPGSRRDEARERLTQMMHRAMNGPNTQIRP